MLAAALLAGAAPARAQEAGYTLSASVARATYPGESLTGMYVFNSLDVTVGPVQVWASVPFTRQSSTGDTIDPLTGAPATTERTSTGLGDPLLRLDLRLISDRRRGLQAGIAVSVKPGIVDPSDGLGTGENDFAVGATVFKAFGRSSLLAEVSFWKYGDPDGVDLQDTFSYSVGMGRVIGSGRWSSMATLSGFSKGTGGAAAPLQLNLSALALAGSRQSLAITAGIGLNDSASDFTVGTSWRIAFR